MIDPLQNKWELRRTNIVFTCKSSLKPQNGRKKREDM